MKRRLSRRLNPTPIYFPLDMLGAIASHADMITARLMRGLCKETVRDFPKIEWNLEEWVKAVPAAHGSILVEARDYMLHVIEGSIKTVFWAHVLKYWTDEQRFK